MIKNALIMILYLDRMISGSKGQFRQRFCKKSLVICLKYAILLKIVWLNNSHKSN